jgi:hypothetical protein
MNNNSVWIVSENYAYEGSEILFVFRFDISLDAIEKHVTKYYKETNNKELVFDEFGEAKIDNSTNVTIDQYGFDEID